MPPTRTTAVTDDKKEGPSTDNAPIAPSRPITAVAIVSPFGRPTMKEMAPLWGK